MKIALHGKKTIFAFVLVFSFFSSLGTSAFADNESKMSWYFPQNDDEMICYWEYEKNVEELDFDGIALCIRCDVESEGKQHVIKANWLPDIPADELEGAFTADTSFYDSLNAHTEHLTQSDVYGQDLDELLAKSGLTVAEASEEWFTGIRVHTTHTYPFNVEILDNVNLYGRNIILGAYGAKALSVEECEISGWQALEATIDYTNLYTDKELSEEIWEGLQKSIIKNYIFLFDGDREALVCVSGTSDMEVLEKIAENIEVRETELVRKSYDNGINYILCDLAKG